MHVRAAYGRSLAVRISRPKDARPPVSIEEVVTMTEQKRLNDQHKRDRDLRSLDSLCTYVGSSGLRSNYGDCGSNFQGSSWDHRGGGEDYYYSTVCMTWESDPGMAIMKTTVVDIVQDY